MTLDEAIKRAEEVAEEQDKTAKEWRENQIRKCDLIPFAEMDYTRENECKRCAEEHRQLAEWLNELKHLRNLVAYSTDFHCTIKESEKELQIVEDKIAYIESLNDEVNADADSY